jgi:alkylation response protein AidB-like acyl-CoA dehydrogenase
MNPAIETCLRADTAVPERRHVADWWPRWRDGSARAATTAAQAVLGGFDADRVGWAFAAGYQAALRALLPELPSGTVAAFCVTEEAGNRPRDIGTRFTPGADGAWSISGAKRWATLGPASSLLLVVGALADAQPRARPLLKVARVPALSPGLRLQPMDDTVFVPEVPHARVRLEQVRVDASALLPGDGYDLYVKPFRTLEDVHVSLAVCAYLLREARRHAWPAAFAERLCAVLAALAELATAPASAPATHIALAGTLAFVHALHAEAGVLWAHAADEPAAQRWQRDAALFAVASSAGDLRTASAWQALRGTAGS